MDDRYRNPEARYGTTGDNPYTISSNNKLQQTQSDVENVTSIMRQNMSKVLERDAKLNEMDERAVELQLGAEQFQSTAQRVKRKYWWKNVKMWVIIGIVAVIILIIIGVSIYFSIEPKKSSSSNTITTTKPP